LGSPVYRGAFPLPDGGVVKARSFDGSVVSEVSTKAMGLAKTGWKVMDGGQGLEQAIDDNEKTVANFPQDIAVDMGKEVSIRAFTYLPRQDKRTDGIADRYVFYTSVDGVSWQKVAEGEFSNIRANPVEQVVGLDAPVNARYFKLTAVHVLGGNGAVVAELGVR